MGVSLWYAAPMPQPVIPTLASLERARATGDVELWLAQLPNEPARQLLRRALRLDRFFLSSSLSSLGSCLYARALAVPSLAPHAAAWASELNARGVPWVQSLRPLPVPAGLVAELHVADIANVANLDLGEGTVLEVCVAPSMRNGLVFEWVGVEPRAVPRRELPEIVSSGWGPVSLVRAPGDAPILLPCPQEGSADGCFTDDGARLFVYGTLDEYMGGFAMLLDPVTLAVQLSLSTTHPVSRVATCDRPDVLVLSTYGGEVVWAGGRLHPLAIRGDFVSLSPDGRYLLTLGSCLQIWSLAELLAVSDALPPPGLPTTFDPAGERLVSHLTLYHGHTGEVIAQLAPWFGSYLIGGPASPWFQCTERHIINLHSSQPQLWDTSTGRVIVPKPVEPEDSDDRDDSESDDHDEGDPDDRAPSMRFFSSTLLAYDSRGSFLAALYRGGSSVCLYSLPPSGAHRTVSFELEGYAVALDARSTRLTVQALDAVEVRTLDGALLRRWPWPHHQPSPHWCALGELRFSHDGARLACAIEDAGWQLWSIEGDPDDASGVILPTRDLLESLPDFAAPSPAGWKIEAGSRTVFTHLPSGTCITFPAQGPWSFNPADPRIGASLGAHVVLR
jgi:hypothetical protein